MYCDFFGLREAPFSLTPDTTFYYGNPSHQEALNTLLVALQIGEGFIKVTGEVGTGKTLLCRKLLREGWAKITASSPPTSPTPHSRHRHCVTRWPTSWVSTITAIWGNTG